MLDPYEINLRHFNRAVKIELKNKEELYGIIIEQVLEYGEVKAWKFVRNKDAKLFKKTQDQKLVRQIVHADISYIENQHNE